MQSVAVRLICEREKEVRDFKAEPYYRVSAIMETARGQRFKAESPRRFATAEEVRTFLAECAAGTFAVSDISVKPITRKPAPPFTTSTLQQEAGRKLGFPVSMTMRVAQKLYEDGLITYMRTDSTNLSALAKQEIAEAVRSTCGEEYLELRNYHTHSKGAQEAHEAIRPTYVAKRTIEGTSQEQKLYDLIWKRAVASQMSEARLEKTNVEISVSDSEEQLRASGETLKFEGFMKVYGFSVHDDEETIESPSAQASMGGGLLPAMKAGESLGLESMTAGERFTQARHATAKLLS